MGAVFSRGWLFPAQSYSCLGGMEVHPEDHYFIQASPMACMWLTQGCHQFQGPKWWLVSLVVLWSVHYVLGILQMAYGLPALHEGPSCSQWVTRHATDMV